MDYHKGRDDLTWFVLLLLAGVLAFSFVIVTDVSVFAG